MYIIYYIYMNTCMCVYIYIHILFAICNACWVKKTPEPRNLNKLSEFMIQDDYRPVIEHGWEISKPKCWFIAFYSWTSKLRSSSGWTIPFLPRKPGEPWGTPCEIGNMSFGDAGQHVQLLGWEDNRGCGYCECCDPYGSICFMKWIEMGVPPKIIHLLVGLSIINHYKPSSFGYHGFSETSIWRIAMSWEEGLARELPSRTQLTEPLTTEDAQCIFPNGSMETFVVKCTVDEFAAQILGMSTWWKSPLLEVLDCS